MTRGRTPLPKTQLCESKTISRSDVCISYGYHTALLLLIQFCEPITATVVFPFVFPLVNETGIANGNQDRVGYYAGLIVRFFLSLLYSTALHPIQQESAFFLVQTLFVFQWSRLSDRIGRKPVVLVGLFGLALSMLAFGLSRSFPALVASRSLAGFLNGNAGALKSILGEITDDTNVAQGFAFLPLVWSTGATIGYV
jgi:MFS family permease